MVQELLILDDLEMVSISQIKLFPLLSWGRQRWGEWHEVHLTHIASRTRDFFYLTVCLNHKRRKGLRNKIRIIPCICLFYKKQLIKAFVWTKMEVFIRFVLEFVIKILKAGCYLVIKMIVLVQCSQAGYMGPVNTHIAWPSLAFIQRGSGGSKLRKKGSEVV